MPTPTKEKNSPERLVETFSCWQKKNLSPFDIIPVDRKKYTKSDVSKTYRALALKIHPDKFSGNIKAKAHIAFQVLSDAKEYLIGLKQNENLKNNPFFQALYSSSKTTRTAKTNFFHVKKDIFYALKKGPEYFFSFMEALSDEEAYIALKKRDQWGRSVIDYSLPNSQLLNAVLKILKPVNIIDYIYKIDELTFAGDDSPLFSNKDSFKIFLRHVDVKELMNLGYFWNKLIGCADVLEMTLDFIRHHNLMDELITKEEGFIYGDNFFSASMDDIKSFSILLGKMTSEQIIRALDRKKIGRAVFSHLMKDCKLFELVFSHITSDDIRRLIERHIIEVFRDNIDLNSLKLVFSLFEDIESFKKYIIDFNGLHNANNNKKAFLMVLNKFKQKEHFQLLEKRNLSNDTVFHLAAKNPGIFEIITSTLTTEEMKKVWSFKNKFNQTPLYNLASNADAFIKFVSRFSDKALLEAAKEKDKFGNTLLHAEEKDSRGSVIFRGAKVDPMTVIYFTKKYPELTCYNLFSQINNDGYTVLHSSIGSYQSEKIATYIKESSNRALWISLINKKNVYLYSVLHESAKQPKTCAILLSLYEKNKRLDVIKEKTVDGNTVDLIDSSDSNYNLKKELIPLLQEGEELYFSDNSSTARVNEPFLRLYDLDRNMIKSYPQYRNSNLYQHRTSLWKVIDHAYSRSKLSCLFFGDNRSMRILKELKVIDRNNKVSESVRDLFPESAKFQQPTIFPIQI